MGNAFSILFRSLLLERFAVPEYERPLRADGAVREARPAPWAAQRG